MRFQMIHDKPDFHLARIGSIGIKHTILKALCLGASFCFAFLFFAVTPAYAYIDAGSGSLILQAIIGTVAAGMVVARVYWDKIKSYFTGLSKQKHGDGDGT